MSCDAMFFLGMAVGGVCVWLGVLAAWWTNRR